MGELQDAEELRERLDEAQGALTAMYEGGSFSKDVYFGSLLQIAEEWVSEEGFQEARDIIALIDEDFFTLKLPRLMRDDQGFHARIHRIAEALAPGTATADESEIDLAMLRGPIGKA